MTKVCSSSAYSHCQCSRTGATQHKHPDYSEAGASRALCFDGEVAGAQARDNSERQIDACDHPAVVHGIGFLLRVRGMIWLCSVIPLSHVPAAYVHLSFFLLYGTSTTESGIRQAEVTWKASVL